jgi:hypothetical protein
MAWVLLGCTFKTSDRLVGGKKERVTTRAAGNEGHKLTLTCAQGFSMFLDACCEFQREVSGG